VTFVQVVDDVGQWLDAAGVVVVVVGVIGAAVAAVAHARRHGRDTYRRFRQQLGRSILLGLELLVAADIIKLWPLHPHWRASQCSPASS